MRFANPIALWALLLLPFLAAVLAWNAARRRGMLEKYASPRLWSALGVPQQGWRAILRPTFNFSAAMLFVIAAARPQWGHEDRKIVSRGVDLIIAADCSLSMLADDYKPNRLQRAKDILQDILWRARGDRLGIIAFAGSAAVKCPLTLDYGMASAALKSVDPNAVSTGGTAIGTAIDVATRAFESSSAGERILVLLTDGEDQGSDPLGAAKRAAKAGVKIYSIGIGTSEGRQIPDPESGYAPKRDRSGQTVVSKLDLETLAQIAKETGGKAVKATPRGGADVDIILNDLARLQKSQQQDKLFRVYKERFPWFLLPALVLLIAEPLITGPRRTVRPWIGRIAETT